MAQKKPRETEDEKKARLKKEEEASKQRVNNFNGPQITEKELKAASQTLSELVLARSDAQLNSKSEDLHYRFYDTVKSTHNLMKTAKSLRGPAVMHLKHKAVREACKTIQRLGKKWKDCNMLLNELAIAEVSRPTPQYVEGELRALIDDENFLRLSWNSRYKTLSILVAHEIKLRASSGRDINFGPWEIVIDGNLIAHGENVPLRCVALIPNPVEPGSDITHPHVRGNIPCLGHAGATVKKSVWSGNFADTVNLLYGLLNTYSSSAPHAQLRRWVEGLYETCIECGNEGPRREMVECGSCREWLCSNCRRICCVCHHAFCTHCATKECSSCGRYTCNNNNHVVECQDCKETFCHSCTSTWRQGSTVFRVCRTCRHKRVKEEEKKIRQQLEEEKRKKKEAKAKKEAKKKKQLEHTTAELSATPHTSAETVQRLHVTPSGEVSVTGELPSTEERHGPEEEEETDDGVFGAEQEDTGFLEE